MVELQRRPDFIKHFAPGVAGGGGSVMPYMGNIGMCRWEGYGF